MKQKLQEFMDFIQKQGVIGLAIGFILGGAVSKIVASLVSDIINPVLGVVLGAAGNLKDYVLTIGSAKIMWGNFLNNVIDFLVVAAVVFALVKILRVDDKK